MMFSRLFNASTICIFLTSSFFNRTVLAEHSQTGTWSIAALASISRTKVAVAAIGSKIYVVGGFNEFNLQDALKFAISSDLDLYDTLTNTWSTIPSLLEGRHHAGIA